MNRLHSLNQSKWLPTPGNMIFSLLVGAILLYMMYLEPVRGAANTPQASTNTISYQGQLTDAGGTPLNGDYDLTFRLYNVTSGGTALWTEQWTGPNNVTITDGLFHAMLGSLTPIPQTVFTDNPSVWLGVKVGTDNEMTPRIQLGSTPFAIQSLTVPDLAIQTNHIADGSVTGPKLSRQLYETILPTDVPMPNANTTYDILSQGINPSEQAFVTIHASISLMNVSTSTLFQVRLLLDGTSIGLADSWNTAAIGEQTMLSTSVLVSPGLHTIKLQALSWSTGGIVAATDGRTRLVIVQE